MNNSYKRRTAASMVKEISSALTSAKEENASSSVIQALETQLLDCVIVCSSKTKCNRDNYSNDEEEMELAPSTGGDAEECPGRAGLTGAVVGEA